MFQRLKDGVMDVLRAAYWTYVDVRDFNPDFDMIVAVTGVISAAVGGLSAALTSLLRR